MIKRFLGREVDGLHAAAYVLGASALLSSLLALLRDRLFAHSFGAGSVLDTYYAAFRVPDLIFVLVASLFSAYVLIPALSVRTEEDQRTYINTIATGFGVMMVCVSAVAYVAMPLLMNMLFPEVGGVSEGLITLSRILLLQPVLLGFSNILAAITQTHKQYLLYAMAPVLYNAGIILGLAAFYPLIGPAGLAWGVVVGALLHAGIQLPSAIRKGFFITVPRISNATELLTTMLVSLPRTLALGMSQLVQLSLVIIAGTLGVGAISVFMFAYNLQSVPIAVIGASYSVAAFPTLARMVSEGNIESFVAQVASASRHILFWTMPMIALMIVLRAHIVRVVLGSGAFDWTDTRLTAASFALFCVALAASAFSLLIIRAYYAAGRSYMPLAVATASSALAVALAVFLVSPIGQGLSLFLEALMRVEDVPGTAVLMLPLASSIATVLGALAFVMLFERHFGGFVRRVSRIFWESTTAAALAGVLAYAALNYLGAIGPATTLAMVVYHGFTAGLVGLLGAGTVYWLFGSPEFYEAAATFTRRPRNIAPVQSAEETITT